MKQIGGLFVECCDGRRAFPEHSTLLFPTLPLTDILIRLTVDETIGVSFACARNPEEKRI